MTLSEIRNLVRTRIKDDIKLTYKDDELNRYINDAIGFLNAELISINDPLMAKSLQVVDKTPIPSDFVRLAGQYPLYISDNLFHTYNPDDNFIILYFAAKPLVTNDNDTIPFSETETNIIIQLAAIYALNRNEFATEQDERLLNMLRQIVRTAKGVTQ